MDIRFSSTNKNMQVHPPANIGAGLLTRTDTPRLTDGSTVEQQGVLAWGLISPPPTHTHTQSLQAAQQGDREREKAAEERETIWEGISSTLEGNSERIQQTTREKKRSLEVCVCVCVRLCSQRNHQIHDTN